MKQEYKELLLKDLCARLPYGVEVEYNNSTCEVLSIDKYNEELTIWKMTGYSPVVKLEEVKPYLFPLSSMTEEQDKEYALLQTSAGKEGFLYAWNCATMVQWLIENHFDYNGLIPKGLANDATNLNIY